MWLLQSPTKEAIGQSLYTCSEAVNFFALPAQLLAGFCCQREEVLAAHWRSQFVPQLQSQLRARIFNHSDRDPNLELFSMLSRSSLILPSMLLFRATLRNLIHGNDELLGAFHSFPEQSK